MYPTREGTEGPLSVVEWENVIFGLFLASSLLTVTTLPQIRFIVPVVFVSILFMRGLFFSQNHPILNSYATIPLTVIYLIHIYHLIIGSIGFNEAARIGIYIFVSGTCIFLLPRLVPKTVFLRLVSYLATFTILVGLPTFIFGPYSLLFLEFDIYSGTYAVPILGVQLPQFMSFMSNPNPAGELAMFGLLASIVEYTYRSRYGIPCLFICGIGLYLINSSAAILGAIAGSFIYTLWRSDFMNYLGIIVISGISVASILYLMVLQLIPGPEFLTSLSFSNRVPIWLGAVEAIRDAPLLGHGPGDMRTIMNPYVDGHLGAAIYNSFLRLFVTTGLIGGLSYLVFFAYPLVNYPKVIRSSKSIIIYSMLLAFVVNEMFSGNSVFGLSFTSIVGALLVGYMYDDISRLQEGFSLHERVR